MEGKIIEITNLFGGYENKVILENFSASINKSQFIAIAGPNGSGKSTLLKYLIKELKTKDKTITICSNDINSYKQIDLAKEISLVSQFSKTDYAFTVKELVGMGRYCHRDELSNERAISDAIEQVGIKSLENRLITTLSGGEFQLAMLARAICQDTAILAMDEPVNNLDPYHELKLMKLLKKLEQKGKTILCVLHDINAILTYCTSCILMKNGKVYASGNAEEVLTEANIKEVYSIDCKIVNLEDGHKLLTFCCNQ